MDPDRGRVDLVLPLDKLNGTVDYPIRVGAIAFLERFYRNFAECSRRVRSISFVSASS